MNHDILLVNQRGAGRSKRHDPDVTQYGTRMAMDDLDAVRAALGYRQLDVIGSSYGATAAQVYLKLHPRSVHTLILAGGTAIDVPFFDRYAVNAQRALDQLATFCAAEPDCRKAFPNWEQPVRRAREGMEHPPGARQDRRRARVGRPRDAARRDRRRSRSRWSSATLQPGDYAPLEHAGSGDLNPSLGLMSSIWCNEPWTGLDDSRRLRADAPRTACDRAPARLRPRARHACA